MKRFIAIAKGRVQKVGYRELIYTETFEKDISGYVKNLNTGEVEIVAEGSEPDLVDLISKINIIRYPIAVKSFTLKWEKATGKYSSFDIIRGKIQEEIFERMDYAGTVMHETLEISKSTLEISKTNLQLQHKMLDKQDQMLDKQDQMLDKQDQMLNKQDQMLNKQDQMLDKQDQALQIGKEMKEEIVGLRKDTGKYLDEEFLEIKKKLISIEDALVRAGIQV